LPAHDAHDSTGEEDQVQPGDCDPTNELAVDLAAE
jgi:hypothetical protein